MSNIVTFWALDPNTGDVRFDASARTWVEGDPVLEQVLWVLRTDRGSCPLDPELGVNRSLLKKATSNVGALWEADVRRALALLVKRAVIADLSVTVQVERDRLLYSVSYTDVAARTRRTFRPTPERLG